MVTTKTANAGWGSSEPIQLGTASTNCGELLKPAGFQKSAVPMTTTDESWWLRDTASDWLASTKDCECDAGHPAGGTAVSTTKTASAA